MQLHGFAPIRGHDADVLAARRRRNRAFMCHLHRARVKSRDLVVCRVGHDHGLGGVNIAPLHDVRCADAFGVQVFGVICTVIAQCRDDLRLPAQQMQGVGDIARAATKFAPQLGHKKRDIQFMDLIGQDLVGKLAAKIHDAVKSQRATNHRCHRVVLFSLAIEGGQCSSG